jgi:hypothetical protein
MADKKVQRALGRNARASSGSLAANAPLEDVGQAILEATKLYIRTYQTERDGSELTTSIFSRNLRCAAQFSARNARTAYLLAKMTLLTSEDRRGVVRTQIIEYGAVAEAILLDVVQAVGVRNSPAGMRPPADRNGMHIAWHRGGILAAQKGRMRYWYTFDWLINQASRIGVVDPPLRKRLHSLRLSRNLVHPAMPISARYTDDLSEGRYAKNVVSDTRDACLAFKATHGLPI